jgi:GT2 family glycosyltransferase
MRITVAIACYNLEDRIADCLKSVIAQDFLDFEILIIQQFLFGEILLTLMMDWD